MFPSLVSIRLSRNPTRYFSNCGINSSGYCYKSVSLDDKHLGRIAKFLGQAKLNEMVENRKKQIENLKAYGYGNLYEWMLFNWGSVGHGFNVRQGKNWIQFETAVCLPLKALSELSKKFPYLEICHVFTSEIEGVDVGAFIYKGRKASFKAFYGERSKDSI